MNLKSLGMLLALCALLCVFAPRANAQDVSTLWIRVTDDFQVADSAAMYFANTAAGTYLKDSLSSLYYEFDPPPPPPDGLNVTWNSFRAGVDPLTYGGYPVDVHGIAANPTVKDTFLLNIS